MLKINWKKSAILIGVLFAVTGVGNLVLSSKATEIDNVQKRGSDKGRTITAIKPGDEDDNGSNPKIDTGNC